MSIKLCNETDLWPDGAPEIREQIWKKARHHTLSLFYFLQHDPQVLPQIQQEMKSWNLPKDEFEEYGHFPPVIYVREGRRMVGEYVFTQHDAQPAKDSVRSPAHEDAVAIGDYELNSHGSYYTCNRELSGHFFVSSRPFQVPYRAILPENVDGLLVPVAVSASRIGFGGIRMEPTWTALGQAAGLAAAQAVKANKQVRDINVSRLQANLYARGAITFYTSDVPPDSSYFKAVQYLGNRGLFQDLVDVDEAQNWERAGLAPNVQYSEAFPYHDVKPTERMSSELAKRWLGQLSLNNPSLIKKASQMNRGEFLQLLYQQVTDTE